MDWPPLPLLSRLAIQDLIPRANRLVCQNAIKHSLHLCNLPIGVDELDQETEYLHIVNALVLRIEKLRYPISSAPNLVIIYMVWYQIQPYWTLDSFDMVIPGQAPTSPF